MITAANIAAMAAIASEMPSGSGRQQNAQKSKLALATAGQKGRICAAVSTGSRCWC